MHSCERKLALQGLPSVHPVQHTHGRQQRKHDYCTIGGGIRRTSRVSRRVLRARSLCIIRSLYSCLYDWGSVMTCAQNTRLQNLHRAIEKPAACCRSNTPETQAS